MPKLKRSQSIQLTEDHKENIESIRQLYRVVISQIGDFLSHLQEGDLNIEGVDPDIVLSYCQAHEQRSKGKKQIKVKLKSKAKTKTSKSSQNSEVITLRKILNALKFFYFELSDVREHNYEDQLQLDKQFIYIIRKVYLALGLKVSDLMPEVNASERELKELEEKESEARKQYNRQQGESKFAAKKELDAVKQQIEKMQNDLSLARIFASLCSYFSEVEALSKSNEAESEPTIFMFGRFWLELHDALVQRNDKGSRVYINISEFLKVINEFRFLYEDSQSTAAMAQSHIKKDCGQASAISTEAFTNKLTTVCFSLSKEKIILLGQALFNNHILALLILCELLPQLGSIGVLPSSSTFTVASREFDLKIISPYCSAILNMISSLQKTVRRAYEVKCGHALVGSDVLEGFDIHIENFNESEDERGKRLNGLLTELQKKYAESASQFFAFLNVGSGRYQKKVEASRERRLQHSKNMRRSFGYAEGRRAQEIIRQGAAGIKSPSEKTQLEDIFIVPSQQKTAGGIRPAAVSQDEDVDRVPPLDPHHKRSESAGAGSGVSLLHRDSDVSSEAASEGPGQQDSFIASGSRRPRKFSIGSSSPGSRSLGHNSPAYSSGRVSPQEPEGDAAQDMPVDLPPDVVGRRIASDPTPRNLLIRSESARAGDGGVFDSLGAGVRSSSSLSEESLDESGGSYGFRTQSMSFKVDGNGLGVVPKTLSETDISRLGIEEKTNEALPRFGGKAGRRIIVTRTPSSQRVSMGPLMEYGQSPVSPNGVGSSPQGIPPAVRQRVAAQRSSSFSGDPRETRRGSLQFGSLSHSGV